MSAPATHTGPPELNPVKTEGFEFVEFAAAPSDALCRLFTAMGFCQVAHHAHLNHVWYQQGNINFFLNMQDYGFAGDFYHQHGPSICSIAFKVADSKRAAAIAVSRGAKKIQAGITEFKLPGVEGVGGSRIYFSDGGDRGACYKGHYNKVVLDPDNSNGAGLEEIDHLTHNVYQGNMDQWANFYKTVFNFHQIKYFNIKGKLTGLKSRAMMSPCGNIRIPINESEDNKSQIAEYLELYNGEGIQHIALTTKNIFTTVRQLRKNGISFLEIPDSYYDMLEKRLPGHGESLDLLKESRVLIDGHIDDNGKLCVLLQIFTENLIGPVFFEIIQRKGDEGFGEGNFQALFDAMERDQVRRGKL